MARGIVRVVRTLFATAVLLMGVLGWTRYATAATAYGLTTNNIVRNLAVKSPTAVTLYGVADGNRLITFNSATPNTIGNNVAITGLQPGETIVGIDEQPDTSLLFAVGSSSRIYTIDAPSGAATQVGPVPFSPALNGSFLRCPRKQRYLDGAPGAHRKYRGAVARRLRDVQHRWRRHTCSQTTTSALRCRSV